VSEPAEPSYSVNTLLGIFKGMKSADKYMRTLYEDGYINNREAQAQIYYKADVVRLKAHPIDMIDNFLQVEEIEGIGLEEWKKKHAHRNFCESKAKSAMRYINKKNPCLAHGKKETGPNQPPG